MVAKQEKIMRIIVHRAALFCPVMAQMKEPMAWNQPAPGRAGLLWRKSPEGHGRAAVRKHWGYSGRKVPRAPGLWHWSEKGFRIGDDTNLLRT